MDLGQQTEAAIFNQKKNTRFPTKYEFMVKKKKREEELKNISVLDIAWDIEKTIHRFT